MPSINREKNKIISELIKIYILKVVPQASSLIFQHANLLYILVFFPLYCWCPHFGITKKMFFIRHGLLLIFFRQWQQSNKNIKYNKEKKIRRSKMIFFMVTALANDSCIIIWSPGILLFFQQHIFIFTLHNEHEFYFIGFQKLIIFEMPTRFR